jgi:hypothetical protein
MRNYLILQSTIPVNQVRLFDDIVVIIAALTNILPSAVPLEVQLPDPYGITKSCWDNDVNKCPDIFYPDIYQYILMANDIKDAIIHSRQKTIVCNGGSQV